MLPRSMCPKNVISLVLYYRAVAPFTKLKVAKTWFVSSACDADALEWD